MFEFFRDIEWGAKQLWPLVAVAVALAVPVLVWAYLKTAVQTRWRVLAGGLKLCALIALLLCILEPLKPGERAVPGANLFLVVADNSQSLQVKGSGEKESRGEQIRQVLTGNKPWSVRLGQQFDVRNYRFDSRIRAVPDFEELDLQGERSTLATSLRALEERFRERPVAGILLFSDGNATDSWSDIDWSNLPPVYPVIVSDQAPAKDISVRLTSVRESNFETTPVTLRAEVVTHGYRGKTLTGQLLDQSGKVVETLDAKAPADGKVLEFRFKIKPEEPGLQFYRLRVAAKKELKHFEDPKLSREATLSNNERLIVVDRGGGPYRLLYVSGRPNWEFKFLQRSVANDDEVSLAGLIRIAKREAKFDFRSRRGEQTNPLFRGFGNDKEEDAEKYDQPVMLRVGLKEDNTSELRDGFPKSKEELYQYDALIIDDLESGLFTQDQLSLIRDFVFQRGGGFLMLGGQESFGRGKYGKTPLEDLLPVYLDPVPALDDGGTYRLALTREGWLKPWVRVRATRNDERKRLDAMPPFRTINRVQAHKPGATVLAYVEGDDGKQYPALVESGNTGRGRSAALLLGDFWRWQLHRREDQEEELGKAWRQTIRWLVAEVPHRIEVDARRMEDQPGQPTQISVTAVGKDYEPLDNAQVKVVVTGPDQKEVTLTAEPSDKRPGVYETSYVPRAAGAYRATVNVAAGDGSEVGTREAGWVAEPVAEEFRSLEMNTTRLRELAEATGGELVEANKLDRFVTRLESKRVPVVERYIKPLWHRLSVFLFAIICLCAEWGIRRWKALP